MSNLSFFNRDISWLSFNERVLIEAGKETLPLMERIRFLSIYSSNLDEFYRVRMPAIKALEKINKNNKTDAEPDVYRQAADIINRQQQHYGKILGESILPALKEIGYHFIYNEKIPLTLLPQLNDYFFTNVAGFLQVKKLSDASGFFPENNQLYLLAIVQFKHEGEQLFLINIPTDNVPRFLKIKDDKTYVIFLEDIIKINLHHLFREAISIDTYNIKITRDAELNLQDEYDEDLVEKMEKQLSKRDFGLATRFLYQPGIPLRSLESIIEIFSLQNASVVEGGNYHNLKDLSNFPLEEKGTSYPAWPAIHGIDTYDNSLTLLKQLTLSDLMINVPYQSYGNVLRFFNEAAIDDTVEEIYTTLYRVANDSKIVHALISAAKNGKKVSVLVELKARFDEANNIKWAKKMKDAGVRIIHSNNAIKVHAKIALIKRKSKTAPLIGLLATGNLNEITARFYTDHILLTANQPLLTELESLFSVLSKGKKSGKEAKTLFRHLLVAQFNLQPKFLALIDREIEHAKQNLPAGITIKLNNLEEEVLIKKLYEASNAGVKINMIVRGICRLVPGIPNQSENISIKRIIDRYLEHGRIFIFHNNGEEAIYMGSADWMNRNIYRRIEVCFPIYDPTLKKQILDIIHLQLMDNMQAVYISPELENIKVTEEGELIRSQEAIYQYLQNHQE